MKRVVFIFRRDLRLEDNTGLLFALRNAKEVILSFIFTPEQIQHNPFRSDRCLQFMLESLEDLEEEIKAKRGKLYLFFGKPEEIVEECIQKLQVDGVVVNRDYTPYSRQRDQKIKTTCEKWGVAFHSFEDALLHPVGTIVKADQEPYTLFTPFFRKALQEKVALPIRNAHTHYYARPIPFAKKGFFYDTILKKRKKQQKGGRREALKILGKMSTFSDYATRKEYPAENGTTHLSAHLKFTTCSPREVYHKIVKTQGLRFSLIRSLYWRDFFTTIAYYFPRVFQESFQSKFRNIDWKGEKKLFRRWCEGTTGFPLVDAGIREMLYTGFMHNRVRMVVASFLIKDLHIDWRWGEKFFAQHLIDYDPAINNGNWQWIASTGSDAQPYFRIFNPMSQALKFDREGVYIKHWLNELASLSPKEIHRWHLREKNHVDSYPSPILNHAKEVQITLKMYKKYLSHKRDG